MKLRPENFLALVPLLFLPILLGPTLEETGWTPGVTKGDFVCYEMYGVFTSSDPDVVIEVPQFEQNNTQGVRIDIIEVSGSVIYQTYTLYFKNETKKFEFKTDLDPDNIEKLTFTERGVPLCAANLNVGASLSTVPLKVNETLIRRYSTGERETNHVSWGTPQDYGDCYFDKKTGLLVELNRTHLYSNPTTDRILKIDIVKMTDSSFLVIQEDQSIVQPSIIAVEESGFLAFSSYSFKKKRVLQSF